MILLNRIVNAPRISFRDIPGKLKLVDSIPMTPAMKKDYRKAKEIGVTGEEITILTKETNMGLEGYDIIYPEKVKIKRGIYRYEDWIYWTWNYGKTNVQKPYESRI